MSWEQAIRAGSWDCFHRKNEAIAARRWFRVDTLLCLTSSQSKNPTIGPASMQSRVSFSGGMER